MNPAFRALQKRNHKLEQQNAALRLTFDRMLTDIEMTESVGCAFAWDLAQELDCYAPAFVVVLQQVWAEALKGGSDYQEARKWLRERVRVDKEFRNTSIEAAGKDPNMEIETPFGRFSLRALTST